MGDGWSLPQGWRGSKASQGDNAQGHQRRRGSCLPDGPASFSHGNSRSFIATWLDQQLSRLAKNKCAVPTSKVLNGTRCLLQFDVAVYSHPFSSSGIGPIICWHSSKLNRCRFHTRFQLGRTSILSKRGRPLRHKPTFNQIHCHACPRSGPIDRFSAHTSG